MSAITQPMFWIAVWWIIALVLLMRALAPVYENSKPQQLSHKKMELALGMLWVGLAVLGLLGFKIIPDALLRPLENRYAPPTSQEVEKHFGMIVLGGATGHPEIYRAHAQVPLSEAAERMTVPLSLMQQHPKLELVFAGGEGRLLATGVTEAELTKVFFEQQGMDMTRVTLERGSRTTRENANQVATFLGERCKRPWLLVTSAWHMPRAKAEFEALNWAVTPYPVDFITSESTSLTEYSLTHSLVRWQMALHEWLGLFVYRVSR